jgi:hypothetical protein
MVGLVVLAAAAPAAQASLSWDTTSFSFGEQEAGVSSAPHTFTLTATCDIGMVVCTSPPMGEHVYGGVTAPGVDFNIDSTNCTGTLTAPNTATPASCFARVAFKPSSDGAKTGVLTTGTGQQVILNGTGLNAGDSKSGSGKKCKKKKKKSNSSASAAKKKKCKKKKKKK